MVKSKKVKSNNADMKKTNIYEVAGHRFAVTAETNLLQAMKQKYGPFLVNGQETDKLVFWLKVIEANEFPSTEGINEEIIQDEDYAKIMIGHIGVQSYFEFRHYDKCEGKMIVSPSYQEAVVTAPGDALYVVNNAAMLMYTLSTAKKKTVLFHASVVENGGRAYLFLGKSGTGKSTHSQLWIKYILGTKLVNDDNPVVRINDQGKAIAYGSPWSGKTPCYRNVSYLIGGFVKLRQAPENRITRLDDVEAYAAIVASISGKRWDRAMADGLHETENALVMSVPVWHLDCRPDREAAELCQSTIKI
jgi:hypothetical protein